VIDLLVACGGGEHDHARACFRRLASLAGEAAEALAAGDVDAWAATLTAATATQADLHAGLVGDAHRRAIAVARAHGALGWKVNGAGGAGGSLTVLAPDRDAAAALRAAWAAADATWVVPDLRPTGEGVRLVHRS
jgi:D-glycero-alpha-D-manno-heptose-7-phosphate kinase